MSFVNYNIENRVYRTDPVTTQSLKNGTRPNLAQRRKARKLVLQALYQWQLGGGEPTDIEAQFRAEYSGKTDWDYFHEVFTAIPRDVEAIDIQLEPYLDRKIETLDPIEKAILRIGVFELQRRVDIPYKVVINECVELAKSFGATESHKYVNGMLDKLAKQLRRPETGKSK